MIKIIQNEKRLGKGMFIRGLCKNPTVIIGRGHKQKIKVDVGFQISGTYAWDDKGYICAHLEMEHYGATTYKYFDVKIDDFNWYGQVLIGFKEQK